MPYCKIETNKTLSVEQKTDLCESLVEAFAKSSSKKVSHNIQFVIDDGLYINFRGEVKDSAHIQFCPGSLTPYEDYEKITLAFLPVLEEKIQIPQNAIYMNITEFPNWGFDHQYIEIKEYA